MRGAGGPYADFKRRTLLQTGSFHFRRFADEPISERNSTVGELTELKSESFEQRISPAIRRKPAFHSSTDDLNVNVIT
jgi:hypothetical protein